jgi:hypothetical protein
MVLAAVTVGEYPLGAAYVWLAAAIVPALIGSVMSGIGRRGRPLWVATGPIAGAALGWGIGISASWGIEPVPLDAWLALGAATVWPIGWGLFMFNRAAETSTGRPRVHPASAASPAGSANGQFSDPGRVRGSEVGDP